MSKLNSFLGVLAITILSYASQAQTPCTGGFADGYPCEGIDLLSFIPLSEMDAPQANDIWGWTSPDTGDEYVMIGLTNGTAFFNITNPVNPAYLGKLPTQTSSSNWRDIKVHDNHAFIVSEANGHGMQVFNLLQLDGQTTAQTWSNTAYFNGLDIGISFGSSHNIAINEGSGYAYVVGAGQCQGGLYAIDINNPNNPTFAGCFSTDGYTHDAQCVNYIGPDPEYQGTEICFNSNENTLTIVDVTDKTDMTQISRTGYQNQRYTHQGWLTEDHQYFLMNDELDEFFGGNNTLTYMWDVRDLDNPVFMGFYEAPRAAIDHNLYVKGDLVYSSNYTSGLRVLDISNIASASLTEFAYFDTYPANDLPQFEGTWSNYPYFESGVIAVSGIREGLFLLKLQNDNEVCDVTGGTLTGGPFNFCVDGTPDNIPSNGIILSGSTGTNQGWVVTDDSGNILGLPPSFTAPNFDGAGTGTCFIYHIAYEDGLAGLAPNNNLSQLEGCFNLSNRITVIREDCGVSTDHIAVGKPATQSSTRFNGVASRAVDGDTNGVYGAGSTTHTDNETGWWRVDLEDVYDITTINIHNRTDCCSDRLNGASLYIGLIDSTDPADYTKIDDLNANTVNAFPDINMQARYIMVRRDNSNFLSLAEVEVYGTLAPPPSTDHIAIGKPATQSSTRFNGVASRAVDGDTNGVYGAGSITHTDNETGWWRVDLEDVYDITTINVHNRTDCCSDRLNGTSLYIGLIDSTNPADYTKIDDLNVNTVNAFPDINMQARYIMVRRNNSNFLSLAEVEVYGTLADDDNMICPPIDLNTTYQSFGGGQDNGIATLSENNTVVRISDNAWKYIDFQYNIASNTVLKFDFRSDIQGEIHGIALENDSGLSSDRTFKLYGTQNWGITDFNNYPANGEWVTYTIPIGDFYTGGIDRIMLVTDHDGGGRNGDSFFRNIVVFEDINDNGIEDDCESIAQEVVLYQDCNYAGANASFGIGEYPFGAFIPLFSNDALSSITIPTGLQARLYQHNFAGREVILTADDSCLSGINFNNQVSSLIVEPLNVKQESDDIVSISIAPNPARDYLRINFENYNDNNIEYVISTIQGQIVSSGRMNTNHGGIEHLDVSSLQNGLYFIHLQSDNKRTVAHKFVIMKD